MSELATKMTNYPENVEQLQKPAEKSDGDDAVMLRRQLEKVDSKSGGARNGTRVGEAGGARGNDSNRTRGAGHQPAGRPPVVGQYGRNIQLPSKNRPKGFPEEGNFYNINHKSAASLDRTNQKHAGDKFREVLHGCEKWICAPKDGRTTDQTEENIKVCTNKILNYFPSLLPWYDLIFQYVVHVCFFQ